jgi:hypothetical protein
MVWDIHNQRTIMSMGMAWDTGAPLWPYQTPDTLFFALNFPAYLIGGPISRLLGLLVPKHYFALFPAVIFWWWLAGTYVDRRRVITNVKKARWTAILLSIVAILLLALGVDSFIDPLRWWLRYNREVWSVSDLIMLRAIAPALWCLVLSSVAAVAAKNSIYSETSPRSGISK